MSIRATCRTCGKQYKVVDSLAGKRAKCKACGHAILIPGEPAAMVASLEKNVTRPAANDTRSSGWDALNDLVDAERKSPPVLMQVVAKPKQKAPATRPKAVLRCDGCGAELLSAMNECPGCGKSKNARGGKASAAKGGESALGGGALWSWGLQAAMAGVLLVVAVTAGSSESLGPAIGLITLIAAAALWICGVFWVVYIGAGGSVGLVILAYIIPFLSLIFMVRAFVSSWNDAKRPGKLMLWAMILFAASLICAT